VKCFGPLVALNCCGLKHTNAPRINSLEVELLKVRYAAVNEHYVEKEKKVISLIAFPSN
jgi:hypothetical protein